jgi:hypothetical protein
MLIPDHYIYLDLENYTNFIKAFTSFRVYCTATLGKSKEEYLKGLERFRRSCEVLIQDFEDDFLFQEIVVTPLAQLLKQVEAILISRHVTDKDIVEVGQLLFQFEEGEREFRRQFIECSAKINEREHYPDELSRSIRPLLENGKYDLVVLAAFRYLEAHLQQTLKVSPHELFGEPLLNYAFSPKSGVLQIEGHPNEQAGLRNLMSGAYAFFRNPSAHRNVKYDEFTACTIVAMVAMMTGIVTNLSSKHTKDIDHGSST